MYYWTSGHPYLTQRVCQTIVRNGRSDWAMNEIDDLIAQLFFTDRSIAEESNLQFVNGRLLNQYDARGNALNYSYTSSGYVERVEEPTSGRFLQFAYNPAGNLIAVTDPISRVTAFGYNALGHLTTITDTRGLAWPYAYTELPDGQYILSRVEDPDGRLIEETGFDSYGRAITQTFRGQDLGIAYFDDGRRVITDGLGQETIHIYNNQTLLVARTDEARNLERYTLDGYHDRVYTEDRNGNGTAYEKTSLGYTTVVTDALGNGLYLEYDANNNWTRREDASGKISLYEYDEQGNLITETNHYSATTTYSYDAFGQRLSMIDTNGVSSQYGYDSIGQMVVITNTQGLTSTFEYDDIGRLITTTDVIGNMTVNLYDAGNNLIQVTGNVLSGYPQNYLDKHNLITRYGYDGVGHQVAVTDTLGMINLALYNDTGRVVTQVVNYDGSTPIQQLCTDFATINPEYNICSLSEYDVIGRLVATTDTLGRINRTFYDEQGRVAGTVDNWSGLIADTTDLPSCLNLPMDRDSDVCTLFGYDDVGNGIIMTDTVGQMTRSYYDELGRIEGMIMNWDGQTTLDSCLTLSPLRDDNVCMTFGYDEVGNTIIMTDTLGQMTRTFYDMLGRETAVVANWNPATLSSPDQCVLLPGNNNTENICSVTTYDEIGNPTVTTNALGQRMLSVYDDSNRPFIQVTNWDGTPITSEADCEFPPTDTSVNLCTVTRYDLYGRPYATVNPMGDENQMAFDSAGRIITTTRYLDGTPIHSTVQYDAMGHRLSQTDANGNSSSAIYDTLYRPVASISAGGIVVTTTYNAAGQTLTAANGLGHNTTMQYDALGRLTHATDAENNVTRYEYDVMGNKTAIIDPHNVRTSYEYDELRRLIHVIENDTGGTQTDDSNILTQYTYNVLGSQISIVNGRNHTSTHMIYDELIFPQYYRHKEETDWISR